METRHMNVAAARRVLTRGGGPRLVLSNFGARLGALLAVGLATLVVARTAGPVWVGALALLRVLPPLAGFLGTGGLPLAAPYFLAGSHSGERNLRPTLLALGAGGALLGAAGWVAITPLIAPPAAARARARAGCVHRGPGAQPDGGVELQVILSGRQRSSRQQPHHRSRGSDVPARLRRIVGRGIS